MKIRTKIHSLASTSPSRFRLSPALVISVIALFVALGGVGYAAATVGTDDIQTGAVTSPKIHNAAVNTQKLAAGAVGNGKIADFAVTSGKLGSDSVTAPKLADTADGVTSQSVPATTTLSVTARRVRLETRPSAAATPLPTPVSWR